MKFFRKNTKYLLAVFMALLLVVWLLEDTIANLGRGPGLDDIQWAQIYGQTVSRQELASTRRETEILQRLGLPWNYFWGGQFREPLDIEEWYMLKAEAQRRGIYVPQEEVNNIRTKLAPEAIERTRSQYKASLDEIDQALRSFVRVQRAFFGDLNAVKVSEADIQDYVRNAAEKARVKLAILDASKFVDPQYQPTEEELKAQFEKYKDVQAGRSEDGMGYLLPEEAQIEYIKISVDELLKQQTVTDEEAWQHWKEHKDQYKKPPATQPTTAPAEPYETFTEARDAVRKALLQERARKEAQDIGAKIAKTLTAPWMSAPTTQPGNYKQPPESALNPELYPQVAESFRGKYGDAITYERTDFKTPMEFNTTRPLASAMALPGTRDAFPLTRAIFLVQGLEEESENRPAQGRWSRNLFETVSEPFIDQEGNAYVFRTIAIRPPRAPESWEVVKEDLIRDIRLQKASEVAKRHAEELTAKAKQVGLEQAANADPALADKLRMAPGQPVLRTPEPFARIDTRYGQPMPTRLMELGWDQEGRFVDTVFDLASETTTQPSRIVLYPMKHLRRWVVAELEEIVPVTEAEYEQEREMAREMLRRQRWVQFASNWLDPENIRARVDFKSAEPEQTKQAAM